MKPESRVLLCAADVSPLSDERLYARASALITEERRRKTERYLRKKDRELSVGAGLLLRKMLRDYGVETENISIASAPGGKPYLADTDGVFFNLSHSGSCVLCAVADCEVGCDIEQISKTDLKLAKRFFTAEEYGRIAAQPTEQAQKEAFFRYWTLKESFMKATGLGMKLPFDRFEILPADDGITVRQQVDQRNYSFTEYDLIGGYRCALCTADADRSASLVIVDLMDCF